MTLHRSVINNDATLFMRADQVEAAWRLLMPVLDVWKASPPNDFPNYAGGTWGPDATQGLLVQQGHSWQARSNRRTRSKGPINGSLSNRNTIGSNSVVRTHGLLK